MTDYFALLDQPRSPWLDPEQLKQAFHAKTLRAHPDAQGAEASGDAAFAEINEAYQVLREPKRRLQHLVVLLGKTPPGRASAIPQDLDNLFPAVAGLTNDANVVLQKVSASTNALSLSLLRPESLRIRGDIARMLDKLRRLQRTAEDELRRADANASDILQQLYVRFSYLGRWIAELEEKELKLSV